MAILREKQRKALWKIIAPIAAILLVTTSALYLIKTQFSRPEFQQGRTEIRVGKSVPDLTLTHLNGSTVQLSQINAKVLMVTFWATWCDACMVEMPSIVQLRNKYKNQGFEVVGINLDENSEAVVPKVMKQLKIEFPMFKDSDGKLAELFDVRAIPLTVIMNHKREILFMRDGDLNWNSPSIHSQLERWLSG